MRKALLVFALVAFLATGTVFAELTGVGEPTVSGSVSTTFGYDLDTEASGFYNDSSLTLTLPLLDGDMTKGGDDGMYGEITVDGIGWQLNNDGFYDVDEDADATNTSELDASISAKLVLNSIYIDLGSPDFSMNNVDVSTDYVVDANAYEAEDELYTDGIGVGFMNDLVTVEFKIASENNYRDSGDDDVDDLDDYSGPFDNDTDDEDGAPATATVPNTDNNYVFGAALTVTPAEGVSIPVTFAYDADYSGSDALVAVGAAPSISMAPLTIDIPVDYVMVGDLYGFEVAPSVAYDLVEGGSNVALDVLFGMYEESLATNALSDISVTFTEDEANGFVPNLSAVLAVTLSNYLDYQDAGVDLTPLLIEADAAYNMGGMKPYIETSYGLDDAEFDLVVGVELASSFTGLDNTTITLDYTNEKLVDGEGYTGDPSDDTESGRVTFDVTVSF